MCKLSLHVVVVVVVLLLPHSAFPATALLLRNNAWLFRNVVQGASSRHARSSILLFSSNSSSNGGTKLYRRLVDKKNSLPHLNVIIPAFNEETRITEALQSYSRYLDSSDWSTYSIIVVDDGSSDDTASVVRRFAMTFSATATCPSNSVQCISLLRNCGKGAALAAGITLVASTTAATAATATTNFTQPQLILTADADGSADIACVHDLLRELQRLTGAHSHHHWYDAVPALVCGYRTYNNDEKAIGRRVFRWGFRTVVRLVCGDPRCRDTQCGFKLMTVAAAVPLYSSLYLARWSHDVEVLLRARILNLPVGEAPVRWVDETDGSKLAQEGIIKVAVQMFVDVIRCRVAYSLGIWTVTQHQPLYDHQSATSAEERHY